jgi:hypothetical protein
MPNLVVTNSLSTKNIIIQDPTGYSQFSMNVPPSGSKTAYVTLQQLAALQVELDALQDAGEITWRTLATSVDGETNPASVQGKYCLAAIERVHMDAATLVLLPDLAPTDVLATAGTQLTTIVAAWLEHVSDGSASPVHDADHKTADTANEAAFAAPLVDTLPHLIAAIATIKAGIIAHGAQPGVHFHDDLGTGGEDFALTVDPPVSQADCNHDINDIKHAFNTHVGLSAVSGHGVAPIVTAEGKTVDNTPVDLPVPLVLAPNSTCLIRVLEVMHVRSGGDGHQIALAWLMVTTDASGAALTVNESDAMQITTGPDGGNIFFDSFHIVSGVLNTPMTGPAAMTVDFRLVAELIIAVPNL